MRKLAPALMFLVAAAVARGAYPTVQDGFIVLRTASSTNVFYDGDLPTPNPDFTNNVTYIYEGENLFLGGEAKTPRGTCNSSEAAVDVCTMFYSVDGGATNSLNMPRIVSGSIDQWQEASSTGEVEIGRAWPVGVHTVSVYFVGVDVNFCLGGGLSGRLPASGSFEAAVEVRVGPADIRACDDAGQPAYNNGWTNGANGGFGFGPWTNLVYVEDGAAGFFVATNPPNSDLNSIARRGRAWGLYANEGGSGGDQRQIAAGFRELLSPLKIGESLTIEFEHGDIKDGFLGTPPQTAGWVGFALRSQMPTLPPDPDPFNSLGIQVNAEMAVGFRGGTATYSVYGPNATGGMPTDLPFTTNGVRAVVTLTGTNTYQLSLTSFGPGGSNIVITGQTYGGPIAAIGIYNRNAELSDAYFNNMYVTGPATTNRVARDNAADPAYAGGWTTNNNGGFGFSPWNLVAFPGPGAAGHFLATNPPNTDLNAIASGGRAWGLYANGPGIQDTFAYRSFAPLSAGQSFGLSLEHGGIAVNGTVAMTLIGNPTTNNSQGEFFAFGFVGGENEYFINDSDGAYHTGIPFTDAGLRLDFKLLTTNVPLRYALTIETRGPNGNTYRFCGRVGGAPHTLRFRTEDAESSDAFINYYYISSPASGADNDNDGMPDDWEQENGLNVGVNDAGGDNDGDRLSNIEEYIAGTHPTNGASFFSASGFGLTSVTVASVTGRLYTLEKTTNLLAGWSVVTNLVDVSGTGGPLSLIHGDPNETVLIRRVRVRIVKD